MKRLILIVLALSACLDQKAVPESRLAIAIAPLSLEGVSDACYRLEALAGATSLWTRRVCASAYGQGGAVGYVGPCDASGTGASTVRVVLEDLCTGGACGATIGPHSIPASDWQNPCPGPNGCTRPATCLAQQDVPVSFDLVIARSANQGFFDVAVTFADIFCSAKADCLDDDGGPLLLLHDPADDVRKQTAVVAFACTGGPGADTWLYYDNLVIACYDDNDASIGEWPYDPSLGPGNIGPGSAPFVYEAATYRSRDTTTGVASWNIAFGIKTSELPGRCVIRAKATASESQLTGFTTPLGATYPYLQWEVELSSGSDTLSCGHHQLNAPNSGITTQYASAKAFSHALRASTQVASRRGEQGCSDTITALDAQVSFTVSPEGLTARVGNAQSPFYPMPNGATLTGCCGDPCCSE